VQDEVDQSPTREAVGEHDGEAVIETWTVMHDREGRPENGLAAVLIPDGRRTWATTQDPDALKVLLTDDMIGRQAHLSADGSLTL
jgi:acetyl-CoA C-acetyltransferase